MNLPLPLQFFFLLLVGWVNRHQDDVIAYLKEENRVLKELQGGKRILLNDDQRRRLAVKGKALGRKRLGALGSLVTPDTILGWYRKLIAKKYDGSQRRSPGRPRKAEEIVGLVVRMAKENSGFGYTRLRDALRGLGREISRSTIKRILLERGLEPAPERSKRVPWKTFLKAHWGAIAAADFFSGKLCPAVIADYVRGQAQCTAIFTKVVLSTTETSATTNAMNFPLDTAERLMSAAGAMR